MGTIGCDIIDIEYTRNHSDYQRRGFLHKVFTTAEQFLIRQSPDPFFMVWRLWSMKESAYKAHQSLTRTFNPSKLVCQIIDGRQGSVTIDNEAYFTITDYTDHYITAIASSSNMINFQIRVIKQDHLDITSQSQACYAALLQQITLDKNWNSSSIEIRKNESSAPYILYHGIVQNISFSTSHHGSFGAFVILD